ncbi:hypothetical protein R1sor_010180 [Riccia sorocarpa]|uniref:Glucuronosyltransferase n=1 Tax=Riccia sorocarpa TaxID=122646 RepID=A0ABD3I0M7_9MARC
MNDAFICESGRFPSTVESMCTGVPLITWPLSADQPMNTRYVTDVSKVGIPMRDGVADESQVLANSIVDTLLSLGVAYTTGFQGCNGDTWSSEIRVLSNSTPRLITTFRWLLLPIGIAMGLLGSLFDSVLGATVQFSGICAVRKKVVGKPGPTVKRISGYDILTNTSVNFVYALLMSLATATAYLYVV